MFQCVFFIGACAWTYDTLLSETLLPGNRRLHKLGEKISQSTQPICCC